MCHVAVASAGRRAMLSEVDPRRIEATVRRLAAFGTRHTPSSQDPVRGIGAARDWIYAQFQDFAAERRGDHQRDRHAARRQRAGPYLRGHRPLRLAGHQRAGLHQ